MPLQAHETWYNRLVKPLIDSLLALIILVVTLPVLILISIVLMITNGGKVFFVQERVGRGEQVFKVVKFRTMNDGRDASGKLKSDHERLTGVGRFVRKTSLDELPQIVNILRGDMSFVGPRPLLPEYLPYYNDEQRRRHSVTPGITGLAQVNGRNLLSWEKRFEFDVWYVDHQSFLLDLKIVLMTLYKVVKSEGISAEGHATMPKFSDHMKSKILK
jgi:undecaprenyl phosphate N,N'-diacetylbacillosamine 1-phosphate transferase